MKLICNWGIFFLIFSYFKRCDCPCGRAEYFINGECCPMCAAGSHVYRHCTADISTTCIPCPELTYTDIGNGLIKCFACTVCDSGHGLRVRTACIRISDTVCEPLDGYYCTDQHTESCRQAEKHTNCSPGQYIKHRGTSLTDTECAECSEGTFSNGSFQICQPHSKCEDQGLTEINPGTLFSDAKCGESSLAALAAGITVFVLLVVTVTAAVIIFLKIKHKTAKQTAEEDGTLSSQAIALQEDPATQTTVTPMIITRRFSFNVFNPWKRTLNT